MRENAVRVFFNKKIVSILSYRNILDWFSLLLATCEVAVQAERTFISVVLEPLVSAGGK